MPAARHRRLGRWLWAWALRLYAGQGQGSARQACFNCSPVKQRGKFQQLQNPATSKRK